ncbi:MAG: hypothetical protein RhofKO_00150 [Rhodothermales bacterium]
MPVHTNEPVRIATIGLGIIGFIDTDTALRVPGVELVAISDVYEGRRNRAKEVYGSHIDAYVDYREVLARTDVDAVLICTPDHWHKQMAVEAMQAGKAVYCEKPMVHNVAEGQAIIEAQRKTGAVFQVGSQFGSSALYYKARDLVQEGVLGELNTVEGRFNRNSALGAWQYSIPTDATPETIDWDRFLGDAPDHPFDADRFFRWRKYWDYGTGVAGDLYVHLFTGIHRVTRALGPDTVVAQGGVRYWTEKREAPDVMMGMFNYPKTDRHGEFTLLLQTNFADGGGGATSFQFVGSEGVMNLGWTDLTISRRGIHQHSASEVLDGYNSVRTFDAAERAAFAEEYLAKQHTQVAPSLNEEMHFTVPDGYDSRYDHFVYFFNSIREGSALVQDPVFALRAAAPSLLCNASYRDGKIYRWDPDAMRVI